MDDYTEQSSEQAEDQDQEGLHHEQSSDEGSGADEQQSLESTDDVEESGYDIATHGGGSLESVPGFEADYALTEGFTILDEGEADDFAMVKSAEAVEFEQPESVCGRDDRVKVTATRSIPWRMICKLIITAKDGSRLGGTGWFIGPRTVMTAGHCVFSHSRGGWVKQVEVVPGMNGSVKPYGSLVGKSFRSVTGWTKDQKVTHDYGCIILPNTTLGKRVGWFGFANLSTSSLRNLLVNNAGYSGDKPFGTLWYNAGRVTRIEAQRLHYMLDTFGGNSGSPTWRTRNGKRHAVGIHNYGGCPNKSTRINKSVYDNMLRWKNI